MNYSGKEIKRILILLSVISALSIIVAAGFAVLYLTEPEPAGITVNPDAQTDGKGETTGQEETENAQLAAMKNQNELLQAQADALESELAALKASIAEHETARIPEDTIDISASYDPGDITPADPASLDYTFDLTTQFARIQALEEQMQHAPFLVDPDGNLVKREELDLEADQETADDDEKIEIIYRAKENSALDEDGRPLETEIDYEAMGYQYPTIAISYRDMERGTCYSYRGDTVFFSASLIKAPYVYTLLHQIAQYNEIKAANPTNDPAVGKTLSEEIWEKYDLERKITVTEDMKAEGSGKIKDMDLTGDGKEFTVLELIEYAIKVSDNTAFRILRNEFGYDYFWSVSRSIGIESVFDSFNNMTADEACIYLAAIYDFAKKYPTEGGLLINLMKNANHQVLITQAVGNPSAVAHKYGWDAESYHDMALVYGDAPYAVCVMTNFDFAVNDDEINAYIRSLVSEIHALHQAFYAAQTQFDT